MRIRLSQAATIATALCMAGCGGGGGGSDPPPPPGHYAVGAALGHLLKDGGSWTMVGSGPGGQPTTIGVAFVPATPGPFTQTGATGARTFETTTVSASGASASGTATFYFDASSLAFQGIDFEGQCSLVTSNTAVPASADPGASGALFDESDFDNCAGGTSATGTTANTWSLEADGDVMLLCWNQLAHDLLGVTTGNGAFCIEVGTDGTLGSRARYSAFDVATGLSFSARNF
jgi:hypothetical protein